MNIPVKNITFSADEYLIDAARQRASVEALAVMRELQGKVRVGRKLTREEMNER